MANVSVFSFFAGCGILDLAFEKTKYNVVFVNEFSQEFLTGYQYAHSQLKQKTLGTVHSSDRASKEDRGILEDLFVDEIREFNEDHNLDGWE